MNEIEMPQDLLDDMAVFTSIKPSNANDLIQLGDAYTRLYGPPKLNTSLSYLRDIYKCSQLPVTAVITNEEKNLFKKLITD